MTDTERAARIQELLVERRGFEATGNEKRLTQVNAELDRLAAEGAPPAKRSTKRKTR